MRQPEPILISRKKIRSIHITRTGWAFILLTIALGIASLNTGNNLLYLIFGMLLSMLILNGILSNSSLHQLSINVQLPPRLYAGAGNPLRIEIKNNKERLPSYAITLMPGLDRKAPVESNSYFFFKISAGEKRRLIHYETFPRRGRHPLSSFTLYTSYPFGLIEKFIPIPLKDTYTIYPELHRIDGSAHTAAFFRGDFLSGKKGIGVNPYGVKEAQYDDDIRHIHWPSFAKVGKWMVKEFEHEKKSKVTVHLIVDPAAPKSETATHLRDQAVSMAASLLMHFLEENRQVGLEINNQPKQPHGTGYVDYYLSLLALFDEQDMLPESWSPTTTSETRGTVVGVTDLPTDKVHRWITTPCHFLLHGKDLAEGWRHQP